MDSKLLFIHSLYRTGSTYLWNTFRRSKKFTCYYEPFNKQMMTLHPQTNAIFDDELVGMMNHPKIEKNYFHEYERLIHPGSLGVPNFSPSFIYKEFCNLDENKPLERYLSYLINESEKETLPLFQFNRSALRTAWFKKRYPHAFSSYVIRHPRHQWQSYLHYLNSNNSFFCMADLMSVSLNKSASFIQPLSLYIPFIEYWHDSIEQQELFYTFLLQSYTPLERYLIFYYIWFVALCEAACNCRYLLSIELLSGDDSYREKMQNAIFGYTNVAVTFEDCRIKSYERFSLPVEQMESVEKLARKVYLGSLEVEKTSRVLENIPTQILNQYSLSEGDFLDRECDDISPKTRVEELAIGKLTALLEMMISFHMEQRKHIARLQQDTPPS